MNKNNKLNNIKIFVTGALSVIVLASGVAAIGYANNEEINKTNNDISMHQKEGKNNRSELSEEQKKEMDKNKENIDSSINNKDYEAWKIAIAKTSRGQEMLKIVENQDEFNKFIEAKSYQDKAQEILKSIGFEENKRMMSFK